MERLDLKVQRPTEAESFAAAELRALAEEFDRLAELAADGEEEFAWKRAHAKAWCRARDLDDEASRVRIPLTPPEAYALSDLMDDHSDTSFGGSWASGSSGAIDWTTFELVVRRSADAGGHIPEAISWTALGAGKVSPLLASVRSKIYAVARSIRESS